MFVALLFVESMKMTTAGDGEQPKYRMTTKRSDDKIDLCPSPDKAIFSIKSPAGISSAIIERTESEWTQPIVIRLHLNGLENLRITSGKTSLQAAVSSHDEKSRIRLWKDKDEDKLLDLTSTYWMEIRMMGLDGKPTKMIPLKDGYFEMTLPKAIFEDNPKSTTVSWIDFYRS